MLFRTAVFTLLLAACSDSPVHEDPRIEPNVTTSCGTAARLVRDVCTKLGPTDACVETSDVCIALCDHATSCAVVGELRVLDGWAVAPNGYCVECAQR